MSPRAARGLFERRPRSRSALPEAVGFTVHLHDVDMASDVVERRAGELLAGEGRGSFMEGGFEVTMVAPLSWCRLKMSNRNSLLVCEGGP